MDPSNRRISLIVQYLEKKPSGSPTEGKGSAEKKGHGAGTPAKTAANSNAGAD
jgi:hypothetical protein